jgi:hypothetical protein
MEHDEFRVLRVLVQTKCLLACHLRTILKTREIYASRYNTS